MTNNRISLAGLAVLALLCSSAYADTRGLSASAQLGTKGLGLHASLPLHDRLAARVGVNFLNYDYSSTTTYTEYDADLRLRTVDALIDWHPLGNGFRVTGGVIFNYSKIPLEARPDATGSINIGGSTYRVEDIGTVTGEVYFRRHAPYIGIGWGHAPSDNKRGLHFQGDIGVMFFGRPRAWLQSSGCDLGSSTVGSFACSQLRRVVPGEADRLEEEIEDYRHFPVLRIGIGYRF